VSTPSALHEWQLETHHLGRRVLLFDRVESTNTLAAGLAGDRANDGLVVVADEQTAGRGQHGRTWTCPPGAGILMSVLLFPPVEVRRPVILAAWAANSVCETILEITGFEARIKWPNDVLLRGRKVCGILIEQALGTVVGIGLNVFQTAETLTEAQLPEASSLAVFAGGPLHRWDVARRLIAKLDEEYVRICAGNLTTLEAAWKRRTELLDQHVLIECQDQDYRGRLRELGWDGLVVELARGDSVRLQPEQVKHITRLSGR
jgi:BirA family transcriptional regulator, biotin operon repressor / biotin---[acetyl-CoA-carboxylase] ligase